MLLDQDGNLHACQMQVLARWFDDSIKWMLVDFQADVEPAGKAKYLLRRSDTPIAVTQPRGINVTESGDSIEVDTGRDVFVLDGRVLKPFSRVIANGVQVLDGSRTAIRLFDEDGREYQPRISGLTVETRGFLRTTLKVEGSMCAASGRHFADFISRISFFAGISTVEIKFTLRNSRAAAGTPAGFGTWATKDRSISRGCGWGSALKESRTGSLLCSERPEQPPIRSNGRHFVIYQDSSGGERWNSLNHMDRNSR